MSGNRKIKINRRLGNPITGLSLSLDSSNVNSYSGSGTNWLDLTTNANNVTFVNEPVFSNANSGVLVFNGSNWGTIADNSSLEFGNGMFTMETWVKFSELRGYQGIISKPGYSDGNGFLFLLESNNKFTMYAGNGAWQVGLGGQVTPNVNEWYHVVITRNVNGEWKMWINGQDQSGNPGVNTSLEFPDNETNMYIGSYTNFPGYSNQPANNLYGSIGLVKVWKGYCMSPSIVEANYGIGSIRFSNTTTTTTTSGTGLISNGLVLNLDAGDSSSYSGTGTLWNDLTTYGNNGTLLNGPTFNSDNGGSISFDGNDDSIEITDSDSISITGDMTISCWLRVTDYNDYRGIVAKVNSNIPNPFDLYLGAGNGFPSFTLGDGSGTYFFNGTVAPQLGVWQNVTITLEGDVATYYLNSEFSSSGTLNGAPSVRTDNGGPLYIGHRPDGVTKMLGDIACVHIYNRALTSVEVSQNYNTLVGRFSNTTTTTTTTSGDGYSLILPFEGDFSDTSSNNLVATVVGNPVISSGSMFIENSGDGLSYAASELFNFGNADFTIESFVKFSNTDGSQAFFTNYNTWDYDAIFLGRHPGASNKVSAWFYDGTTIITLQESEMTTNEWVHYALVRYNNTISLYKNGISVDSTSVSSTNWNENYVANVGFAGDNPSGYGVQGYLDSFKVSKVARYTSNFTPEAAPTTTTTTTTEAPTTTTTTTIQTMLWSSYSNGHTSLNNGAQYDSGTDIYTVDGVNDYALLTNAPKPTSEMTLMAWVKADQLGGWRKAVIFPYGANSWQSPYSSYQIATDGTQFVVAFQVDTNFSTGSVYTSGATTNTWYHVAGTFKNGVIKMYINGQLVNTKDVSSTGTNIIYTNHSNMLIGLDATYFQQEQWDGQVSNIEIHSVELSGSAILNKYNSTSAAHSNTTTTTTTAAPTTTTTTTAAPTTTTTTTSSGSVNLIMNLDAGNISSYPGTGTNWYDLTNTYSGISLVNGATFDSNSGGSIVLDGVNDYVSLGNIAVTPNKNKFTFNAVYKFDKSKANAIFSTGTSGSSTQDILFAHDGNVFFFQINNNADGGPVANYSYTSNTWLNVCVVYDATQANNTDKIKVYFNGVQNTLSFGSFNVPSTGPIGAPSYLGKYISYSGWDLKGNIAIAQLYDGALTSGEVAANFDAIKDRFGLGTTTTTTTTAAPTTTTTTTAAPTTTTTTTVAGGSLFSDARGLYSLRLVNPSYSGSAIRVRRSSDNVEQNIGFSSGELDTTSLTSFVGSNTGYVVTWFDQSGNSFDITQSNTTKQPRIINNGTMYTLGSKPSVYFDNTTNTNVLSTSLISGLYNTSLTSFSVASKSTGGNGRTTYSRILSFSKSGMSDYDNVNGLLLYLGQSTAYTFAANSNISAPFSMDTKTLFVSTRISGNLGIAVNGGSLQTLSTGMANMNSEYFRIGNDVNESDSGLIGHVQEVILYNSDKTSIISNVKSNINTYYGIY